MVLQTTAALLLALSKVGGSAVVEVNGLRTLVPSSMGTTFLLLGMSTAMMGTCSLAMVVRALARLSSAMLALRIQTMDQTQCVLELIS
jgi:hypothetical protein